VSVAEWGLWMHPRSGWPERHANAFVFNPDHPARTFGDVAGDKEIEFGGNTHRTRDLKRGTRLRNVSDHAINCAAAELDGASLKYALSRRCPVILQTPEFLWFWLPVYV
jgi:hypothetical protein